MSSLTSKIKPSKETSERIDFLSEVGFALNTLQNENTFETDFLSALGNLNEFENRLMRLELKSRTSEGMLLLVKYLEKKIRKRLKASHKDFKM